MAEESDRQEIAFEVNEGVLQSAEFSGNQFQEDLRRLVETMGDSVLNITGPSISHLNTVRTLHYLAESLSVFEDNETLERQIDRFKSQQEARSHVPTLFFARYILREMGEFTFEPEQGDILLDWEGEPITFEFKRPRESGEVREYREQHQEKLETIKSILDDNFQYDIRYTIPQDIEVLLPLLEAEVDDLDSPGKTLLTDTIEVGVRNDGGFNEDSPVDGVVMHGAAKDLDSGELRPLTNYSGTEARFSLAGPKIDETEKLENLINTARKQLSGDKPNIIVIHIRQLMGSISELKREAQGLFNSSRNTRINAVVLWDYHYPHTGGIEVTTRTIRNPYAANELPDEFFDYLPNMDEEPVTD